MVKFPLNCLNRDLVSKATIKGVPCGLMGVLLYKPPLRFFLRVHLGLTVFFPLTDELVGEIPFKWEGG